MRLSTDEIQFISRKIVKTLVAAGRLEVDDEPRVVEGLAKTIADELSIEENGSKLSSFVRIPFDNQLLCVALPTPGQGRFIQI